MTARIQNDEPSTEDTLNREKFARALVNVVTTCGTPLVIGLYGTWGIGKTSLMRQIESLLADATEAKSVWFDPWQHQFDEDPAIALLHTVVDRLNLGEEGKKLLTVIAGALGSILLKATTTLSSTEIQKMGEQYEQERFQVREKQIRLRRHFSELISRATNNGRVRLIFFIDDLDRCAPEQILRVLEALKLYLNLPDCVYLLGVDRTALEGSIKLRYKDLPLSEADYLDKIVQLPFTIPPIARDSMEQFISPLLPEDLKDTVPLLVQGLGDNPRHVKRFVNSLLLNHQLASEMFGDDYRPTQLAGILLIQYRQPDIFKSAIRDPEQLLKLGTEDSAEHGELLERDAALSGVLPLANFGSTEELARYIYLSEVAGVRTVDYNVVMTSLGPNKIQVIKVVRERTGAGLKEAKDLVESSPPVTMATGVTKEEAELFRSALTSVGAEVEVR